MWKYVPRRIRDTLERSVNYFDKRSTTNVVNSPVSLKDEEKTSNTPCRWFYPQNCWDPAQGDNNTNSRKWNFEHLNQTWIGAITWSSALVVGWYASQLIHLKLKYCPNNKQDKTKLDKLKATLHPYLSSVSKESLCHNSTEKIENLLSKFTPKVHLISNEDSKVETGHDDGLSTSTDSSDSELGDVLNSIENKLGFAAIQNGNHQEGLNLLRSAAQRNYAPALYNLGLCYELGLGVVADEKVAMTFYRSAAALHHPRALYNLGIYYGQGRGGLTRNNETALRLLKLAAVQGQQEAIMALESIDDNVPYSPKHEAEPAPFAQTEQIMQTAMLLENIGFLKTVNCEARVY